MARQNAAPVYLVRLQPRGPDAIRALRSALKVLGRQFQVRCVSAVEEERRATVTVIRSSPNDTEFSGAGCAPCVFPGAGYRDGSPENAHQRTAKARCGVS
jgi:hypothetical protein